MILDVVLFICRKLYNAKEILQFIALSINLNLFNYPNKTQLVLLWLIFY